MFSLGRSAAETVAAANADAEQVAGYAMGSEIAMDAEETVRAQVWVAEPALLDQVSKGLWICQIQT